jgi:hypothetical protein
MAKRGNREASPGDKIPGSKLSLDQQAAALAFATQCSDAKAAERHGISLRTLHNYRARLATDPALAKLFEIKRRELSEGWKDDALDTLRKGLHTMTTLMDRLLALDGPPEKGQLYEVTGAVKVIGELLTVKEVLGVEQPGTDTEDRGAEEAPGQDSGGGEGSGGTPGPASEPVH